MENDATRLLSESPVPSGSASLEDMLRTLLELTQSFNKSVLDGAARDDEALAGATFTLIQAACRLTGADGASLYSSMRQGYLDRQAFCWDPHLSFEQMRTTSQIAEHVEVGDGIAGFIALDAEARSAVGHQLGCPIREGSATEVWDIPRVDDLPERLRQRTTQLLREGTIDIGSMYIIKGIGADGVDFVLQLIRKRVNGEFSAAQKLVAEVLGELIFPEFRNIAAYRAREAAQGPASAVEPAPTAKINDTNEAICRIAADAYEAIQAVTSVAMDKIGKAGAPHE